VGQYVAGFCGASGTPAQCTGSCRSAAGNGSTNTCKGACVQVGKADCTGICRTAEGKGCNGTLRNPFCEGNVLCGQNTECSNACQATAQLSAVCEAPIVAQIFSVSDAALYAALQKHAGELGKTVNRLSQLRNAFGFISNRALGDFLSLGLSGDLVRACVSQGNTNVQQANALLASAVAANPTTRKSTAR